MATITPTLPAEEIDYPESDGKPMAETDTHLRAMIDTISTLQVYFRDQPNVYVSGNLLLYYEEGNPRRSVAPDTFVVFGVPKGLRRTYKLWEEGQPPTVVIEFTSRSTRQEDEDYKYALYATLGVREYFLSDPLGEYLRPALQGYRLVEGEYERLEPDANGALLSEALGLRLQHEHGHLRLVDAMTGQPLLRLEEAMEARQTAEAQTRAEMEARLAAEAQARIEGAMRRALEEQVRAILEAGRAFEERVAALEAEQAQLRALVARLQPPASGEQ